MVRKGISPLVAAVLLIAITMTIAGFLAYWATSFVRTSLPETNKTEAECRFADFNIYSCTYNSTSKVVYLILENRDIDLMQLRAYFIFANSTVSDAHDLNTTLPANTLKSFTISGVDNFSKISVKTHCPDVSKEKTCT